LTSHRLRFGWQRRYDTRPAIAPTGNAVRLALRRRRAGRSTRYRRRARQGGREAVAHEQAGQRQDEACCAVGSFFGWASRCLARGGYLCHGL